MDDVTAQRTRLAAIDRELPGLRSEHDLAMSAFKFDQASLLQRRIEALENERRSVVAALPEQILPPEPPSGVVPMLARPRRARRRRIG